MCVLGGKGRQIESRWGEGILRIRLNDRCMAHTEQQSVQATGYTDHLQLQNYPQVIPHESERKTRDDGGEGCCVLHSLCRMLSYLHW